VSGLQLTYTELRRQISQFIGVGRTYADYSSDPARLAAVNDSMVSGLRNFCWPVLDSKNGIAHRWSFLDADYPLTLVPGQHSYPLPPEFLRLTEQFCFDESSGKKPIMPVKHSYLRTLRAMDNQTGDPLYCAIRRIEGIDGGSDLHEVSFYPTPNAEMTLSYSCEIGPYVPSSADYDTAIPFGGPMHAEAIIESCLAAAEAKLTPEAGPGTHTARFKELLVASIEIDRQQTEEEAELMMWPVDAETGGITSLAVTKSQLMRLIGRELGFPPHPKAWHHGQLSTVAEVLRNGLRKFYQPMVLPNEFDAHQWAFLHPVHKFNLISGISTYDLPEDFSMVSGTITYGPSTSIEYPEIKLVPEEDARWKLQSQTTSTRPAMAAYRVKSTNELTGTRYEIQFAPIPSESLQIDIPYAINPEQLGNDQSLPMGGQPHAQTIIEACLAAAEIQMKSGTIHQQEFERCLKSSVSYDRKMQASDLGYSLDRSDCDTYEIGRRRNVDHNPLTYYVGTGGTWPQ
jgi:hypothetical protein